jgi:hypothetical protein
LGLTDRYKLLSTCRVLAVVLLAALAIGAGPDHAADHDALEVHRRRSRAW